MERNPRNNEPRDGADLSDVAERLADRRPVDWSSRPASQEAAAKADNLRLVERITNAYQNVHESGPHAQDASPASMTAPPADPGPATDPLERVEQQPPLFLWGRLRVLERIGGGSFADVYRAYDPALRLEVALKLQREGVQLDETARQRFLAEARVLARVRHEHVLTVHGVDVHNDRVGIWTDLVRGRTLAEQVTAHGPLGPDEVACIGMNLCSALAAVHATGLVHGDLKPTNVMREEGGHIVLMDLGSARRVRLGEEADPHSVTGTPLTTAPEVLLHCAAPRPTQDIYGLGVLLYWLLTKRYPVEAKTLADLVKNHERRSARPLIDVRPDVPPAVARVIERALAPRAEDRFASAGEMELALATALGVQRPRENDPARRRALLFGVGLVLIVGLSIAAIVSPHLRPAPQVSATLYREDAQSEERLADGGKVRPNEQLFLEILLDRPMHVWVVNEDERGNAYVLFPLRSDGGALPLAAGTMHRLPGVQGGEQANWITSADSGRETILVVAAQKRLPELERVIAGLPRAGASAVPSSGAFGIAGEAVHRGIQRVGPRTPGINGRGVIARLQREYGDKQGPGGVWLWKVQLFNEGS